MHFVRKAITPAIRGKPEHSTLISVATYSPWRVDGRFRSLLGRIAEHTLLDEMRLYELWGLSEQVKDLPGDAIEVGCWLGGAGCLIAHRAFGEHSTGTTFLCDTFAGVAKAGSRDDVYRGGEHGDADPDAVRKLATELGLTNVEVLVGLFPDDTGHDVADRIFKFAHIDVDVYQGARDAFEWLLPRWIVGGVIVFDDYGSSLTGGIRTYVDELQSNPDVVIVRNLNGQAVAVRRGATTPAPG